MNQTITKLINILSKLPGIGARSARRIAIYLINNNKKTGVIKNISSVLKEIDLTILECENCHNYDMVSPCGICSDAERSRDVLCVVEQLSDMWAIERSKTYNGLYHILGGSLSAIDGIYPEELNMTSLYAKISSGVIREVIIATNPTIDGKITSNYICNMIEDLDVKVSRLSYGIPIGGELDYLDEYTLEVAMSTRVNVRGCDA